MVDRPYGRYTKERTWAAMYSQHIIAGYALVPSSLTTNSIDVIAIPSSTPDLAKVTQEMSRKLLAIADELEDYYSRKQTFDHAPALLKEALDKNRLRTAVVLAKSSDYHLYNLTDNPGLTQVICGLHDSFLNQPVWEMKTNKRYKPRETAITISSPEFEKIRATQFGHNILLGALVCGDKAAIAFRDSKLPASTRWRILNEVDDLQNHAFQGRNIAFRTESERLEIIEKIREGVKKAHEQKRLRLLSS
jgi:hypothetical protein